MKKTDSNKGGQDCLSRARGEDQRIGDPKGIQRLLSVFSFYFCKKLGHIKKNYMKQKEMLKRKDGKNSDEASTSEKSDQAGVVEEGD